MKITPPPRTKVDPAFPVVVSQPVHRAVWKTAMRYAAGDPSRIRKISTTEVEVLVRG